MPKTARDYSMQDDRFGPSARPCERPQRLFRQGEGIFLGGADRNPTGLVVTVPPVAFLMSAGAAEPAVAPVTVRFPERWVTEVAPTSRARSLTRERPSRFLAGSGSAPKRSTSSSARSSTSAREPRPEALR